MATLKDSLALLRSLPNQWEASWSSGSFDPRRELSFLSVVKLELDNKVGGRRGPMVLDGGQFLGARTLWEANRDASLLPGWAIRNLCNHPSTALDQQFLGSLDKHPQLSKRRSWAEGLIANHYLHWELVPELEERAHLLKGILNKFPHDSPWLLDLRSNDWEVLGQRAPDCLINQLGNILDDLDPLMEKWGLTSQQGLGKAVTLAALRRWSNQFRLQRPSTTDQHVIPELRHAFSTLLNRVPMGKPFLQTVEDLILSEWSKSSPNIREHLSGWCLSHQNLGDPRQNTGNWHPIPIAKAKLLSWIARRDLIFFYDKIVPSRLDDQGRKEFWLRYVESVIDFRIAIGSTDQRKLISAKYGKHEIATLDGAPDLSAFILKFAGHRHRPDIVCVEFSRSGNALYIYDADVFDEQIEGMNAISFRITPGPRNIKNQDAFVHRQAHYINWQAATSTYLNSRGITPSLVSR